MTRSSIKCKEKTLRVKPLYFEHAAGANVRYIEGWLPVFAILSEFFAKISTDTQ